MNLSQYAIEMRDVHKSFGGVDILKGMNIGVHKGETMVIVGASGTGKSVSIRQMSGLQEPDKGNVYIEGQEISRTTFDKRCILRSAMGVLFQSGALINWLSVYDNVALPLREKRNISEQKIDQIVREKLIRLNLLSAKNRFPSKISGGMKKRAGLARALVTNPRILLYDEPTSGLDPVMSQIINNLITEMQKELGVTQVVVTHDMDSAYSIADRITFLYGGKTIFVGTPDEIRASTEPIIRQFICGKVEGPMILDREVIGDKTY